MPIRLPVHAKIFSLPALYERDYASERWQRQKATLSMDLLAPTHGRVLDLACGTGWATRVLRQRYWCVGCDLNPLMLSKADDPRLLASGEELPFSDRAFGAVVCSELLEHLPRQSCERTVREMERVAAEEIVCSVPYRQNLSMDRRKCPHCGAVFHVDGHLSSFDEGSLAALFRSFTLKAWIVFGEPVPRYRPGLISLGRALGLLEYRRNQETLCPGCDTILPVVPSGDTVPPSRLGDRLIRRLAWTGRYAPYWLIALFQRARSAAGGS